MLIFAYVLGNIIPILFQAIKHKLNLAHFRADEAATPNEEEKARLLLGSKLMVIFFFHFLHLFICSFLFIFMSNYFSLFPFFHSSFTRNRKIRKYH